MKVRLFVTGSAALLATWLGVTYVREVPQENYPQLGKGSLPLSAEATPEAEELEPLISLEGEVAPEVAVAE
ncbi:hypothetical protein HAHE_11060 [Haloferula helveola]|uniref:Uncharacterized protein n=2 Tax=Haloferula helveola TaxID=490095 RepID=A0ABN6H5M2_9BACT|nr:hypothetical protein HAHE_11060 [Haloferula helveola]